VVLSAEALARDDDRIGIEHLPLAFAGVPKVRSSSGRRKSRPPPSPVDLEAMMRRFRGNMLRVARELDRKPALVYRWAKRFGLNVDEFRAKTEA
jgi:hypothetical protein